MKTSVSIFILFLLAIITFSCGNKKRESLCRTWKVSDVQFINEKESTVISDTMKGNQIEVAKFQLRDILMKNLYEFRDDGTYVTGNELANSEGEWELQNDAIEFTTKSGDEVKHKKVKIDKFERDTLILMMQNDQTSLKVKLLLTPLVIH